MAKEKTLCRNCGGEVIFSETQEEYLAEHGCKRPPLYCEACFVDRLRQICEIPGEKRLATCSVCGQQTRLGFIPCQNRPVYCPDCFKKMKEGEEA